MGTLGGWEWIIILVIVVLVFGVGRISKISGEIGSSIRAFREGVQGDKEKKKEEEAAAAAAAAAKKVTVIEEDKKES